MAAAAIVAAAAIAALATVLVYAATQRSATRDRKRQLCARAVGDALAWMETPYRIRRRLDDSPSTLRDIATRLHELQEALLMHESWLRVESQEVFELYKAFVVAIEEAVRKPIQEAWRTPASPAPQDMNIGEIAIDHSGIDTTLDQLTERIREEFG